MVVKRFGSLLRYQREGWLTEKQDIKGQKINMSRVLDNIREVMP